MNMKINCLGGVQRFVQRLYLSSVCTCLTFVPSSVCTVQRLYLSSVCTCLAFVLSSVCTVQRWYCLGFVCLGFVLSSVCLSSVCSGTMNLYLAYEESIAFERNKLEKTLCYLREAAKKCLPQWSDHLKKHSLFVASLNDPKKI